MNAKLKRTNNLLALARHYMPNHLLKQIYHAQFNSHLSYGCQIWGFDKRNLNQTKILQNKAIRLMTFSNKYTNTKPPI